MPLPMGLAVLKHQITMAGLGCELDMTGLGDISTWCFPRGSPKFHLFLEGVPV